MHLIAGRGLVQTVKHVKPYAPDFKVPRGVIRLVILTQITFAHCLDHVVEEPSVVTANLPTVEQAINDGVLILVHAVADLATNLINGVPASSVMFGDEMDNVPVLAIDGNVVEQVTPFHLLDSDLVFNVVSIRIIGAGLSVFHSNGALENLRATI